MLKEGVEENMGILQWFYGRRRSELEVKDRGGRAYHYSRISRSNKGISFQISSVAGDLWKKSLRV